MKKRIVVLLSGKGTNLEAIIEGENIYNSYEVAGCITNVPTCEGIQKAVRHGKPVTAMPPKHSEFYIDSYHRNFLSIIGVYEPDIIVLAGYMKILSPWFVQNCKVPVINIHPSLLPKYKGLNTHKRVLEAGDKEHGITIHYVNEEMDSGEIIYQSRLNILPFDTEETLENRIHSLEHLHYPRILDQLARM